MVTAKRLVGGHVAIDLLPGPSELLVLADDTANPKFIAADMLAQAEHGSGHERVWLVTTSEMPAWASEAWGLAPLTTTPEPSSDETSSRPNSRSLRSFSGASCLNWVSQ